MGSFSSRRSAALAVASLALAAACGDAGAEKPTASAPTPPPAAASMGAVDDDPRIPVGLEVGMRAPEFQARDSDGVSFRLSDYRGKVVVLDFWGFW